MVTTLAYLPFRVVYAPTKLVGRVVAWLAEGYRSAPLRCRGHYSRRARSVSLVLHAAARRAVEPS